MTNGNSDHDRIVAIEQRVTSLERWRQAAFAVCLVIIPVLAAVVVKAFTT